MILILTRNESHIDLMKVRDIIRMIEEDGWYLVATRGSHRQYKHPSHDLTRGTLNSILKQAQLKE